jgi:putative GTP pyrophosphokinase
MTQLADWNDTVHIFEQQYVRRPESHFFILTLDSVHRSLNIRPFRRDEAVQSQREYDKAERETESTPGTQVVLVSVDDLDTLPNAYPNYYVDTKAFIKAVERELDYFELDV